MRLDILLVDLTGNQAAVVVQHLDPGHQDQFIQLGLHQHLAIKERRENFCEEFHFSSNNAHHFFLRAFKELDVVF